MNYVISAVAVFLMMGVGYAGELHAVPGTSLTYYLVNSGPLSRTAFILFPGGDGADHVTVEGGRVKLSKNFLVSTAETYVKNGFTTVIVNSYQAMTDNYRVSTDHAKHIQVILDALTSRGVERFYLVGTSRGTLSVASLATKLSDPHLKGIILTSSMASIARLDLPRIKVPVLFVHHVDDKCHHTPHREAKDISRLVSKSTTVSFVDVTGGLPPQTGPCQALSPHGFFGVEGIATQAMINWARGD